MGGLALPQPEPYLGPYSGPRRNTGFFVMLLRTNLAGLGFIQSKLKTQFTLGVSPIYHKKGIKQIDYEIL